MPNGIFLRQPEQSIWKEYTWKDVGQQSRQIVGAFQKMNLKRGDRIALLSANCAEWFVSDLAIMMGS